MHELKSQLINFLERIEKAAEVIEPDNLKKDIKKLELIMSNPAFWNDTEKASNISRDLSVLTEKLETWDSLIKECKELIELCDIIDAEREPQAREDVKESMEELQKKLRKAEIALFLNKKYDKNNAILTIHAGTGGTDAHDWAKMLMRMFTRYFENKKYGIEVLDKSDAADAGIKNVTFKVKGPFAYGYLKEEAGVHRLVRRSPFNVGNTRETSFAMVEVLPELENEDDIKIKDDDLRIDVFAASGPGGQSVNTSNSAIRITHLPTSLVASCQNQRSQLQNKQEAMKMLKGKLVTLQEKQKAKTIEQLKGEQKEASWGNQIRSYVLHPYQMVKDHRTSFEINQIDKMLDGELLEEFIEASLEKNAE